MEEVQSQRRAGGRKGPTAAHLSAPGAAHGAGLGGGTRARKRARPVVPRRTTTARGTSHQRPSGALLPVETGKKAAHTSTPMGPLGAHLEAKPPERAPGTEPDARPEHAPALSNFSQWRTTQRAPEAGSGNTARRPVRGGGHRGGLGTPLEGTYFQAELGNAMCVQSLDDSLNSAIHIKYRISLRSSSFSEPRYPPARVV